MSGGKIIKVSGPLVIASDLINVRMYDVVKVGLPQLIGEVIGLEGNTAFIQVYEETTGIGPDEPVVSTGEPLSVELGPGLIGGIYDGIQRPLTVIREMSGNFISRGIDIPKLDRKKKWTFKPTVKKGDQVITGDIIGTVQETELVVQRIMIPPGLTGEVTMIKAGDFTVEETVCQVKQNGESQDIKMAQHWPVRKMRPVKEKLPPCEPLVTGQRVIDTFFPVAKGGTACIPGPFGSGKCVTGDTPVFLASGQLELISDIYEKNKSNGKRTISDSEEYTVLDQPLEVFTYQNGKINKQKVSAVYKGKTNRILEIKTRTGRIAKITPIHKLFTINGSLEIIEQEAWKLKEGDYLVSPRWLDFSGKLQRFDEDTVGRGYRIRQQRLGNSLKLLIDKNLSKFGTKKNMAKTLGISYAVFIEYYSGRNNPTVDFINKLFALTGEKRFSLDKIKGQRQSKEVRLPKELTKDLAMFFGLVLGDGMVKKNSVRFYNNEKAILDYYSNLTRKIFEVSTKRLQTRTVKMELLESNIVANFLRQNGYPEYQKSRNCFVPHKLLLSPVEVIGAFLGAYFICDGYIDMKKGEIEITTASRNMSRDLLYLCLRLGILARLREKTYKGRVYYRILISGKSEIEKFYRFSNIFDCEKLKKVAAFLNSGKREGTTIDIIPISPEVVTAIYNKMGRPYQMLRNNGLEIHNYLNLQKELMSRRVFRIFTKEIGSNRMSEMAHNHFEHLFCDRIEKIEEITGQQEVYDLEVPEGHNFVGGVAPMFFHNTVVQHQLAKWADAQIIVYVGCGERGNEMTDVLMEFPKLKDPRSGEPLIKRTVLIANTSNMPVSAREASVYTGITIAEYFRDMGYTVALMADSTSRWAEALREMSGRLEEMPGEEGYPAYLSMRIAEFYERAGRVKCAGSEDREGSLSVIGAVSPPGGDLSDPVVQSTLRVVKVFWSLEDKLAYMRHFPAINCLNSYSLYLDNISEYVGQHIGPDFLALRRAALKLLQDEASLEEIVRLVGVEALSANDRLTLATAKSIREDFLHQMAFDPEDTYTSYQKQYQLLKLIMHFHHLAKEAISHSQNLDDILKYKVREKIAKAKYIPEEKINSFNELFKEIEQVFKSM